MKTKLKPFLKKLYLSLPFKKQFYQILKKFWTPSPSLAGYLKFKGAFILDLEEEKSLIIYNDHSTLPTLIFWLGLKAYEPLSLKLWQTLSKQSSSILDIGANFGLFGLIAQSMNPRSQVIFFEPLTRNTQRIAKNLALNQFQATIEAQALSDQVGQAIFYDMNSSENTIGSLKKVFVEKHPHHAQVVPVEVKMNTLDHFIQEEKISSLDLIKIDVEGLEFEVIRGFEKALSKFKPVLLIEISSPENAHKLNEFFQSLGFQYSIYEINEALGIIKRPKIICHYGNNYLFCPEFLDLDIESIKPD